ncbi:MAG: molecular chaperone HtpG, partial [Deltaproteobacteria bacterium]|nr:molecular chaperone HtpG [Deltaproteobacteria bacterium]
MSTEPTEPRTHRFQAEVSRVLSLVIHSLYSNREVFLRELVSNASDALDKLRFRAVTEPALLPEGHELKLRICPDKAAGTLTLEDSGVGMTAEQLERELGTVAHSGTRAFLERLGDGPKPDVSLIGQFGVGFYSAYLVSTRVEVVSRAAGTDQAHRWVSDGVESFTIEPAERAAPGTTIVLHLRDDAKDFVDAFRLRSLVKRYSDYLDYPIELEVDGKSDRVNQGKALWQRRPSEVTAEQYAEFYRHLTHDYQEPLAHRHFQVEGTQMFTGLLFVPKEPPFDLFSPDQKHGIRLHVKRVFVLDDCKELLPTWLRFVRGIVDSEDLPLNVSRELLQDSSVVRTIRRQVTRNALELLAEVAGGDPTRYDELWARYGKVLKEGLHFEPEHKDRLVPLLRYESSAGPGLTSLAAYRERMKPGQKAIYYVVTESRALAERSPHAEGLRRRGLEVLYMSDGVDSFALENLDEFDGVPLVSATSPDLALDPVEGEEPPKDRSDEVSELRAA